MNRVTLGWVSKDIPFPGLVADYDVVIMKHCYPASSIAADCGNPDPSSSVQSTENYKAIYRLLRDRFDEHPDTLFILWTLPPLHRLATDSDSAVRATDFSEWLKTEFLTDGGSHRNIYVWDFRGIVMDADTNCLKYEYERDHSSSDSHPNSAANNAAGPLFAQFVIDSVRDFTCRDMTGEECKVMFTHRSTGGNVYNYPDGGVVSWIEKYNASHGTKFQMSERWYPWDGNMPVDYYRTWLAD